MTTLAELTTPLTVDEVKAMIYAALAAAGVTTTSWKPGAVVRTLIAGVSVVLAALTVLIALIAASGFLDLAEGAWLTLKARYDYDVTKDVGSFATGQITLTNTAGGVYSGGADDLIFANSLTGKTYRVTESWSLAALGSATVAIQAVEIGSASTSDAGEIDSFVTPLNGVTCSNAAAVIGSDEETDAALRERCRAKTGALSPNGPRDAYLYIARSTTSAAGASIGVTRVTPVPDGYGNVVVYVATASGGVTGTSGNPATDLGAIQAAFDTQVEPIAITATATSASAYTVAVTYELWVRNTIGMTEAEITDAVSDAITSALSTTEIGGEVIPPAAGKIYVDTIKAAAARALPVNSILRLAVTLPAADLTLAADDAPVAGTITPTAVHFIARGDA